MYAFFGQYSRLYLPIRHGFPLICESLHPERAGCQTCIDPRKPSAQGNQSMEDYLVNDRGVLLICDGDGKFHCSPGIRRQLEFLN
jgi:hypothetical protein